MKSISSDLLIKLDQVTFSYPDNANSNVLNVPRWRVDAGENVLVIGESGSGKSTLLKLLSGMLVPDSGAVVVAGQALETLNSRQRDRFRAEQTGYVAQSFNLIPYLSALNNIKLANYFAQNTDQNNSGLEVTQLLQELNIEKAHWSRPISQLSIGQQQRIAIARALINKPKVLIADEPTSSLDQSNRDNFMEILFTAARAHQMTLVFVSHDLSLKEYFHRIDTMHDISVSV